MFCWLIGCECGQQPWLKSSFVRNFSFFYYLNVGEHNDGGQDGNGELSSGNSFPSSFPNEKKILRGDPHERLRQTFLLHSHSPRDKSLRACSVWSGLRGNGGD